MAKPAPEYKGHIMANFHGKAPPSAVEAERQIIGSMIIDPDPGVIETIRERITADDLFLDGHRKIYESIIGLVDSGAPVDYVTVCDRLETENQLPVIGGAEYITELAMNTPSSAVIEYHLQRIADTAKARKLIHAANEIIYDVFDQYGEGIDTLLDSAQARVFDLNPPATGKTGPISAADASTEAIKALKKRYDAGGALTGIPTGLADLDDITNGWQPGNLIVIAARPSMGKTALAMHFAIKAASNGTGVIFYSLEQSRERIIERIWSARAVVNYSRIRTGRLAGGDFGRLDMTDGQIRKWPLTIDDTPGISIPAIRSRTRRLALSDPGIGLIIVDYLQITDTSSNGNQYRSRDREIADNVAGLKNLAREIGAPVILLSQLNRDPERRSDHRPTLGDLRDSGTIEQDADIVGLLYRPDYYDRTKPELIGLAELNIAKNREGETKLIKLKFAREYVKFTDA